jgi:hypothetical protein
MVVLESERLGFHSGWFLHQSVAFVFLIFVVQGTNVFMGFPWEDLMMDLNEPDQCPQLKLVSRGLNPLSLLREIVRLVSISFQVHMGNFCPHCVYLRNYSVG